MSCKGWKSGKGPVGLQTSAGFAWRSCLPTPSAHRPRRLYCRRGSGASRELGAWRRGWWYCGCPGATPSALKQGCDHSVRHNIARQLVNPRAGFTAGPGMGLPLQAARHEMEKYKIFKAAENQGLELKLLTQ